MLEFSRWIARAAARAGKQRLASLGSRVVAAVGTRRVGKIALAAGSAVAVGLVALRAKLGDGEHDTYAPSPVGARVELVEATALALDEAADVRTKKATFFDFMRPIVEAEIERIRELRARIAAARESGDNLESIASVADRYDIEWSGKEWNALLKAVDIVPLRLALAQSANESSWGASRFAQEGNNMFGQWCFEEGCGMVPKRRDDGRRHEVRSFETVNHSVRSYFHNINTSSAYREFRELRWRARMQGREPDASRLAAALGRYSERGEEYVEEIRSMIRVNLELMAGGPRRGER